MSLVANGTFEGLIRSLDVDPHRRGKQFEKIVKWWLQNDPIHSRDIKKVWLWDEWPDRPGPDVGIDLVAELKDGSLVAVQAKCFDSERDIPKSELDSFISAASPRKYGRRMLVASTDGLSANARRMLHDNHVTQVMFSYLDSLQEFWPSTFLSLGGPRTVSKWGPRTHQSLAIHDVTEGLRKASRGQLIMACGTGKTLTAMWIMESLDSHSTLVLVPSLSLLSQTLLEWSQHSNVSWSYLCVCSDDTVNKSDDAIISSVDDVPFPVTTKPSEIAHFLSQRGRKIIFSTYQSSAQVARGMKSVGKKFDLVICDEAHRLTGKNDAEFATALDDKKIPAKKRLFMTATPRTYTASVKSKASERGVEITSMDDETAFGKELHKLSFGQAIEQELLTDYRVVIVGVTDPQVQELIERRELVTAGNVETDARTLAAHIGLAKATKDYDLKRTISFHGRIKTAQDFAQNHASIVEWMPDDHKPSGTIWADTITGAMNSSSRRKLLDRLKADVPGQHALLSNARCLTEGIDVPSLDGVAFIDPRSSQVDIIQAVGRAIRKADNKTLGTIVLPVLIPHDEDIEHAMQDSAFKPIWAIVNALRSHDEELANELNSIRFSLGETNELIHFPSKITLNLPVDLETISPSFKDALQLKLIERASSDWKFGFGRLSAYATLHGNSRVPQDFVQQGFNLGSWVSHQRILYKRQLLNQEKIHSLESISNWVWDEVDQWWFEAFNALKDFASENQHTRVPRSLRGGDVNISAWITRQRVVHLNGDLSTDRQNLLESLPGWSWGPEEERWNENFHLALKYCKLDPKNTLLKETKFEGINIGGWVQRQRGRFKDGILEPTRTELLESIPNWTWDATKTSQFGMYFEFLEEFCRTNGHSRVPQSYCVGDIDLGGFVARCRSRANRLSTIEKQLLEALPRWTWNPREARWDEMHELLLEYVSEYGTTVMRQVELFKGRPLGNWVHIQRSWYRTNRLRDDRAKSLEAIKGWTWEYQ